MNNKQIVSLLRHASSFSTPAVSIFHLRGKSMTKHLRLIGCLLLASLSFSLVAFGQTDAGSIVGTVTDNSGAVLANESVSITNTGNNAKIVVRTDSSGNYSATPLKIGTYTVS